MTGHFDHDAIGMAGNVSATKKVELLKKRFADELKDIKPEARHMAQKDHYRDVQGTLSAGRASEKLREAGITTLPGIAKAMKEPGKRGLALRAMGNSVTAGTGGAAMAVGVPLAMNAPSLMKGNEEATGGSSMKRKLTGLGLSIGTGSLVGGLPLIPQMVAGTALDTASQRAARGKRREVQS
jgi:hypothetical protein